jgi:hypothetical protein
MRNMKNIWTIWKHALGAFNIEDGYDPRTENAIAIIRTTIVGINLLCALIIIINVLSHW